MRQLRCATLLLVCVLSALSGTGQAGEPAAYGYAGRELDGSGLVYGRSRSYDPTTGRYTQRDSIGLAGGNNDYGYVGGDPITARDPQGTTASDTGPTGDDLALGAAMVMNGGYAVPYSLNAEQRRQFANGQALAVPVAVAAAAAPKLTLLMTATLVLDTGLRAGLHALFGPAGVNLVYGPPPTPYGPQLLRGVMLPGGKFTPALVESFIDAKLAEFAAAGRMQEFLLGQGQARVAQVAGRIGHVNALELWPANMNFRAQLVNGSLPAYLERASIQFNEYIIERLYNANYNFSTIHPPQAPITSLWYQAELDLLMFEKGVVPAYIDPTQFLH